MRDGHLTIGGEMVKSKISKSAPQDSPLRTVMPPGIGSMDPVSFWPFLQVIGCCEHFYSHLVVSYIEECRWDGPERDTVAT